MKPPNGPAETSAASVRRDSSIVFSLLRIRYTGAHVLRAYHVSCVPMQPAYSEGIVRLRATKYRSMRAVLARVYSSISVSDPLRQTEFRATDDKSATDPE